MANPRLPGQNGIYGGGRTAGFPSTSSSQPPADPFTLYEALPFSPMTSIAPFYPDVIPTPDIGSGLAPSLESFISGDDFAALNLDAGSLNPSRRVEHSLEQVQQLLNPSRITQFKFKTPSQSYSEGQTSLVSLSDSLRPFSKLVYNRSSIAFRDPSSDEIQNPWLKKQIISSNRKNKSPTIKQESHLLARMAVSAATPIAPSTPAPKLNAKPVPSVSKKNVPTHQTARFELAPSNFAPLTKIETSGSTLNPSSKTVYAESWEQPTRPSENFITKQIPKSIAVSQATVTPILSEADLEEPNPLVQNLPPKLTENSAATSFRVEVNLPRSSINVDEYQAILEISEAPDHLSSKRDGEVGHGHVAEGLDLVQQSEKSLRDLRRCFQEIFRCETLIKAQQAAPPNIVVWTSDGEPTLTDPWLRKVRTLMQATIDLKSFSLVPTDDLVRMQRLCEAGLRLGDNIDIRLNSTWSESEVITWVQQLPEVEFALKSARTTLCIMSGGSLDKRLYSEDIIDQCIRLFRRVLDGVVIPCAEIRGSVPTFKFLTHQKKGIMSLLSSAEKLLSMMARLMASIELSDMVVNCLEDSASRLIFIENAHAEKDSIVPVQKFDTLRLVAMDLLCQVFQKNPGQRMSILNSILTSLEKLPLGKSSARHFKLSDGGNIQPVSALIMRLVQASAGFIDGASKFGSQTHLLVEGDTDTNENCHVDSDQFRFVVQSESQAKLNPSAAVAEMQSVVNFLCKSYNETATYICNFLIGRAKQSNKTGDSPYRNLLEMFIEDFTSCLDNPSWPSAMTLLRIMLHMSLNIVSGEKAPSGTKSSVSAINMALELMGIMGAAMARIRSHVKKTSAPPDSSDADELWYFVSELANAILEERANLNLLTGWSGPYRTVLEYLDQRSSTDPHLSSAISFVVLEWAKNLLQACRTNGESEETYALLAYRLRMMILDRNWLSSEFSFAQVAPAHARLSYSLTVINSELYSLYRPILHIFFQSMSRDEVTVRSKSLKSITQLIETDPTILDGKADIYQKILEEGLGDPSPQVRESALGLISTCLTLRPQYERTTRPSVLERLTDTSIGVRKRAMRLARDLYLRSENQAVRTEICRTLLIRLQDQEDSVRELARHLVEEIWITPFANVAPSGMAQTSLNNHVFLVVKALNAAKNVVGEHVILTLVKGILGSGTKADSPAFKVCESLVSRIFSLVTTKPPEDPTIPTGAEALHVLVVFAKVDCSLFTFEQIRTLRPFMISIPTREDTATSIATLHIYRQVVPTLSTVHKSFLEETRALLQGFLIKAINAHVLDEIVACLWAILRLLKDVRPMCTLVASSLAGALKKVKTASPQNPGDLSSFTRYCLLVGMVTKYSEGELENLKEVFIKPFGKAPTNTASKFIIDTLVPFASPSSPRCKEVRKACLEAIAHVCQSNPKNYVAANVYTTFQEVFRERDQTLEALVLSSFLAFLIGEEKRTANADESHDKKEAKRELTVMGGTSYDDVASATTQRFLKEITRIALQDVSPHSKLALEVLGSINRQGLTHPKETGVTFITLETCPSIIIAEMAHKEHKLIHVKHEQVLEREYAKAIQSSYNYQRDVINDRRGARPKPDGTFEPKFVYIMEVLKISRSRNRQKFLEKLVKLIDFDITKLKATDSDPQHVHFSRYILENLAFFDYITLGEVMSTVVTLEKLFYGTGSSLAQSIESDIFNVRMDAIASSSVDEQGKDTAPQLPPLDTKRLRLLTSGSMILSALYETRTYLRKLWNLGLGHKKDKAKLVGKDLSKAPMKIQGVAGEKFWEDMERIMASLESEEKMLAQCRSFVDLMTVDNEVKVDGEDDEGNGDGGTTSGDEDDAVHVDSVGFGRGRKRKLAPGAGLSTGRGKKRPRSSSRPQSKGKSKKNLKPGEEMVDEDMEWI